MVKKEQIKFIDSVKIYTDEHLNQDKSNDVNCEWKYSFTLCTTSRKFYFFVISEEELFLWMSAFYRLLGVQVNA